MRLLAGLLGQATDVDRSVEQAVNDFIKATARLGRADDAMSLSSARAILDLDAAAQIQVLHRCFSKLASLSRRLTLLSRYADWDKYAALRALVKRMLRRKLPYTEADVAALLDGCARLRLASEAPYGSVIGAVERFLDDEPVPPALVQPMQRLRKAIDAGRSDGYGQRQIDRIDRHLTPADAPAFELPVVDAWTAAMRAALDRLEPADVAPWLEFLAHCNTATAARPSRRWLTKAERHLHELDRDRAHDVLLQVLRAVARPAPTGGGSSMVSSRFADCLRGLIWTTAPLAGETLLTALGEAAERCFRKLPGHGPLAPKIGNACLHVLAHCGSVPALAQIARLKTRVKHASSRRQIDKALSAAAKQAGITTAELEELAVPTCGLDTVGSLTREVGEFSAHLEVITVRSAALTWHKADGKQQKSVPQAVKSAHADAVRALQGIAGELKKVLPAQAVRLERMLLSPRSIPFDAWTARYRDHPVVGFLAARLIWSVEDAGQTTLAGCAGDALVDVDGTVVVPSPNAALRLWHPIDSSAGTVRAWRDWLAARAITQPFKQAHREIYVLTDAERETGIYSNRFAAHVLRQHQFQALCQQRGWVYALQGEWDSHNTPCIELPEHACRVELWVDPAGRDEGFVSSSGVYLYVATDQVRFTALEPAEPIALADVAPVVFSELMRDVDLFVGVCSVGNDPNWADGGPDGHYAEYWTKFAFGDLSETAKTRRQVLEGLLPKLKIADRLSLEERFLSVRGELRSYRIHLGSGNILMTPNDRYLCIVPGRGADTSRGQVMLPFEGDGLLSIVLSKAFMLAADKQIKDPAIVSQIRSA